MKWAKALIIGVLVVAAVMAIASAIIAMAPYLAWLLVIVVIYKIVTSDE